MRVLQLGPYPPPEGGINRNILAIRAELLSRGNEAVIVATSRSTRIDPEPNVHHPGSAFALVRLLLTLRRDITHLHIGGDFTGRVLALVFVCGLLSRGKILSIHSGGYPETSEGRSAKKWSLRGFVFRMFDRIIVVNEKLKDVFIKYGVPCEKVSVIFPFVNENPDKDVVVPDELARFAEEHEPFLLTVGLLEPEYDLVLQIDAISEIRKKLPGVGLMIVGSGSLEKDLKNFVASSEYSENVMLAGDVPHSVTLHLIQRADLLLRTTRFDGDAISVREALFLGTPVVATDNGMRPDGLNLIPIGSRQHLEAEIIRMAESPKPRMVNPESDRSNIATIMDVYSQIA